MEALKRTVTDWLTRMRSGQVQLPRCQRFEACGYGQVKGLRESLVNDLPVGAALILVRLEARAA